MKTTNLTLNITVDGKTYIVDVTIQDCSWSKKDVSYVDKQVHINHINGGKCLDVFMANADLYFTICKEATTQGLRS